MHDCTIPYMGILSRSMTANSKALSVTYSELTCIVVVCKLVKEAAVLVCIHTYSIAKIKQCMLR